MDKISLSGPLFFSKYIKHHVQSYVKNVDIQARGSTTGQTSHGELENGL